MLVQVFAGQGCKVVARDTSESNPSTGTAQGDVFVILQEEFGVEPILDGLLSDQHLCQP